MKNITATILYPGKNIYYGAMQFSKWDNCLINNTFYEFDKYSKKKF